MVQVITKLMKNSLLVNGAYIKKFKKFGFIHPKKLKHLAYNSPIKKINYKIPLKYKILSDVESGRYVFLKLERKAFCIEGVELRDNIKGDWQSVMLRDVNLGTCMFAPTPNQYFKNENFPYLKIIMGNAIEMTTKKELIDLYKSKICIGEFDMKLENYIAFSG